jgi:hypothetical protein
MRFTTSTHKGTEGFNISYGDERTVGHAILAELPKEWTVHFDWCQILFADVQYQIDAEKKRVEVQYCQSLMRWSHELVPEIAEKVRGLETKKRPTNRTLSR